MFRVSATSCRREMEPFRLHHHHKLRQPADVPCQGVGEHRPLPSGLRFPYERAATGDGDNQTFLTEDAHGRAHRAARDTVLLLQVALARQGRTRLQLAGGDHPPENVRELRVQRCGIHVVHVVHEDNSI
jgi:hypothetical protein